MLCLWAPTFFAKEQNKKDTFYKICQLTFTFTFWGLLWFGRRPAKGDSQSVNHHSLFTCWIQSLIIPAYRE